MVKRYSLSRRTLFKNGSAILMSATLAELLSVLDNATHSVTNAEIVAPLSLQKHVAPGGNLTLAVAPMHVGSPNAATKRELFRHNSDLIGTTEMMRTNLSTFTRGTGYNAYHGNTAWRPDPAHDPVLFVQKHIPILASHSQKISNVTPGSQHGNGLGMERWATSVIIQHPKAGRIIHINTHLNAGVVRIPTASPRRIQYFKSLENIRNLYRNLEKTYHPDGTIITGDMNWWRTANNPIDQLAHQEGFNATVFGNIIWVLTKGVHITKKTLTNNNPGSDHVWGFFTLQNGKVAG